MNIGKSLMKREQGNEVIFEYKKLKTWSRNVSIKQQTLIPIPVIQSDKIIYVEGKENFIICLSASGHSYFYNFLSGQQFIPLNDQSEHVFKLGLIQNSVFLILQKRLEQNLKFFLISLDYKNFLKRTEILSENNFSLENLIEFDYLNNNLVVSRQNFFQVFKIPSCNLITQASVSNNFYFKNQLLSFEIQGVLIKIILTDLSSFASKEFFIENPSNLKIFDYFSDFLIFSENQELKRISLKTKEITTISAMPKVYCIGNVSSIAVFDEEFIMMNKNLSKVSAQVSKFCGDLEGIVVVLDKN